MKPLTTAPDVLGDSIGFVSLVDRMNQDAALKAVNSARISFNKQKDEFDDKDARLIDYLMKHGHTSPFRHSFYTFHIKAPLFVFRQWWKHQVGATWAEIYIDTDSGNSWNEISGRYVELEPEFYFPEVRWQDQVNKQGSVEDPYRDGQQIYWTGAMKQMAKHLHDAYTSYINAGVAKEVARMILPVSTYSEAYWTVSLQAVMHFLKLRLDSHAQPEIQRYAEGIKSLIQDDLDMLGISFTQTSLPQS